MRLFMKLILAVILADNESRIIEIVLYIITENKLITTSLRLNLDQFVYLHLKHNSSMSFWVVIIKLNYTDY